MPNEDIRDKDHSDFVHKQSILARFKMKLPKWKRKRHGTKHRYDNLSDACSMPSISESEESGIVVRETCSLFDEGGEITFDSHEDLRKYDDVYHSITDITTGDISDITQKLGREHDRSLTTTNTSNTRGPLTYVNLLNSVKGSRDGTEETETDSLVTADSDSISSISMGECLSQDGLSHKNLNLSEPEPQSIKFINVDNWESETIGICVTSSLPIILRENASSDIQNSENISPSKNSSQLTLCSESLTISTPNIVSRTPSPDTSFVVCQFTEDLSPLDYVKDNQFIAADICLNNSGILSSIRSKTKQNYSTDPVFFESIRNEIRCNTPEIPCKYFQTHPQQMLRYESPKIYEDARQSQSCESIDGVVECLTESERSSSFVLVDEIDAYNLQRSATPGEEEKHKLQNLLINTSISVFPEPSDDVSAIKSHILKMGVLFKNYLQEESHQCITNAQPLDSPDDNGILTPIAENLSSSSSIIDGNDETPTIESTRRIDYIDSTHIGESTSFINENLAEYKTNYESCDFETGDVILTTVEEPTDRELYQKEGVPVTKSACVILYEESFDQKDEETVINKDEISEHEVEIISVMQIEKEEYLTDEELLQEYQKCKFDDDSSDDGYSDHFSETTYSSTILYPGNISTGCSRSSSMETLAGYEHFSATDNYHDTGTHIELGNKSNHLLVHNDSEFLELPRALKDMWNDDSDFYDVIRFLNRWGKYNVVMEGTLNLPNFCEDSVCFHFSKDKDMSYLSTNRSGSIKKRYQQTKMQSEKPKLSNFSMPESEEFTSNETLQNFILSTHDDDQISEEFECTIVDRLFCKYKDLDPSCLNYMNQKTLFCQSCGTPHNIECL